MTFFSQNASLFVFASKFYQNTKFWFEYNSSRVITPDSARYLYPNNSWILSFFRVAKRGRVIRPNLTSLVKCFVIKYNFLIFWKATNLRRIYKSWGLMVGHNLKNHYAIDLFQFHLDFCLFGLVIIFMLQYQYMLWVVRYYWFLADLSDIFC